jgi:hypothetical protein
LATTIQVPLELLTVNLADANAYWNAIDDTNFDFGAIHFESATAGKAYFGGIIPKNLAGTPAWNLFLHHMVASGTGASAVTLTINALDFANGSSKKGATLTSIIACATAGTSASANIVFTNIASTLGGSANLDGVEALGAGNDLVVEIIRQGADAGDTARIWQLVNVILQVDVT